MRIISVSEARGGLPLVFGPNGDPSLQSLVRALAADTSATARHLEEHGALLFRGFAVRSPDDFEQVARAIDPELRNDYFGTSPRDAVTPYVFSASELPPHYPIPQHCEMTFVKQPPRRLFFSCLIEPASPGGETPLCDFRRVAQDLDPEVRERFKAHGVRIIHNYAGPATPKQLDLWKLERWDEVFRTTDRAEVEQKCRENDFEPTWLDQDRLRLVSHQASERKHPVTGEDVWFNHSQVFHLSAAEGEYRRIAKRQRLVQSLGLAAFARLMTAAKKRKGGVLDQALHCTFGDGAEISQADMEAVRDAVWKNMVFVPWRHGDVVVIDNFAIAHGRMPYRGPRQVVVCWA